MLIKYINKTPYFAVVSRGMLEIAKLCDEKELIVVLLSLLFISKTLADASDALYNYLKQNIKSCYYDMDKKRKPRQEQYVLVRCQSISEDEVKIIKIYDKETIKVAENINKFLLLI